ncbi:MAG: 8-oxoguanine deaminase [Rhodospirillaceae bacterium]|nr:MAG: 8-oxoguanine deaminase [Rhodospirillaceae bacterium]
MSRLWIRNPLAVFSEQPADGGIVVEDGRIAELVAAGQTPAVDEVFDASGLVLIPGLINTHHHMYQTLTRALPGAVDKELFDWLKALYPVWAGLSPDMVSASSELAMAELLLSGCTTTTDHHYVFPSGHEDAIDRQVAAAQALGIRVILTRGSMSLSVEDGGLPPASVVQDEDSILDDSARLIDRFHDPDPLAMVQIALAPCSPFSVTRGLMQASADLAKARGVLLHTHLAETEDENAFCEATFGCRPLDYVEDCGWLETKAWYAHGVHFNADERARMAQAGAGVSSCSHSNMHLASGICSACELESAGVGVGLGVDGSASNDASNMMQEVRAAWLLQRLKYGSAAVSWQDALRWGTAGSAGLLGREVLGRIAPGMAADLALFGLDEPRFSGAGDPLAALVVCGAHRAEAVMVGGHWRVRDGVLVGHNLEDIMARHCGASRRLQASR